MSKTIDDATYDAAHGSIDDCTIMTVCTTQPTTYTEMATTYKLADVVMTAGTDYTIANGDTSGRKVTVAAKNAVAIDTTGTALFIALGISGSSTLKVVTTCTSQALTSGGTVNIPAWDIEIADPT